MKYLLLITSFFVCFVSSANTDIIQVGFVNKAENDKASSKQQEEIKLSTLSAGGDADSASYVKINVSPSISNVQEKNEKPAKKDNSDDSIDKHKLSKALEKIAKLEDETKKISDEYIKISALFNEQKEWNKTLVSSIGTGFAIFSLVFGVITFAISRRAQNSAELAFQSIKVAADTTIVQLGDVSEFRNEVEKFRKEIEEGQKDVKKIKALSTAIDFDLAVLVNSESKLNAMNFLITDYRSTNLDKLKRRLIEGSSELKKIRQTLETHLNHYSKKEFDNLKGELKEIIKNHLFRNIINQALVAKDIGDYEKAIQLLTESEKFCTDDQERAMVYYNKACYYSCLEQLGSSKKFLILTLELSPSFKDNASEDPDLVNLRSNQQLWNEAIVGLE